MIVIIGVMGMDGIGVLGLTMSNHTLLPVIMVSRTAAGKIHVWDTIPGAQIEQSDMEFARES